MSSLALDCYFVDDLPYLQSEIRAQSGVRVDDQTGLARGFKTGLLDLNRVIPDLQSGEIVEALGIGFERGPYACLRVGRGDGRASDNRAAGVGHDARNAAVNARPQANGSKKNRADRAR